jgi:hypothetical protein
MADGHKTKLPGLTTARAREAPFSRARFEAAPEFEAFKRGMKKLLAVPKATLDKRVEDWKATTPRLNNPNAPGRKRKPT